MLKKVLGSQNGSISEATSAVYEKSLNQVSNSLKY